MKRMLTILKLAYGTEIHKGGCAIHYTLLAFLLFLFERKSDAQNPPRQEMDINRFIQDIFPLPAEESNYEDLYESLFQLYANPLNLNLATRDELVATYILSDKQIQALLAHRTKLGPFISLYELQSVSGFDLTTIYRLLPFVTVESRPLSVRQSFKNPSQHFLMLRSRTLLEQQKGFSPIDTTSRSATRYEGNSLYGYLRYRNARTGVYSLGLTLEKDSGEKWWNWNPRKQIFGPDFTSFHAQIMNRGKLKNLVIGDFQMQAGQGMILAAGFSLGKGSEVIRTTYRSTLGLRPYTSVLEANFFRGIATTYAFSKQFEVTSFYARTRRDANVDNSAEETIISSLLTSGYHRTPAERLKQNSIREQNIGFHSLYKLPAHKGQIGITLLSTRYGAYLTKRAIPYNLYEFKGKHNLTLGIHGDYLWQNFHFFGEGARSKSGGIGGIAGLIAGLGKSFDFTLLARHYDKDFHTFYGNAVSEATRPINESGTYWGLRYSPNRRWQFSTYYDRFRFPWLKYQINAPASGNDFYVHILWKPNKRFNAYALFREKHVPRNLSGTSAPIPPLAELTRRSTLINVEYEVPLRFSIRTRIQAGEMTGRVSPSSRGIAVIEDITWKFTKLELSGRIAFFSTDDYDSRQYVYEKDMLYAFSLPAYYDKGTRHYLMARYNLTSHMKVWLRWAQTRYSRLETIGSGLSEIRGNKRSELKMQVMYQF